MKKKAMSEVIAVGLFLVIAVLSVIGFQNWYTTFSTSTLADANEQSKNSLNSLNIENLQGNTLYIKTNDNTSIKDILINGVKCQINQTFPLGVNGINVEECLENIVSQKADILVVSDKSTISKKIYVEDFKSIASLAVPNTCNSNGTVEGFHNGLGSLVDPWQICSCSQLQLINNYLGGNFSIVKNVDCSETLSWNAGLGFSPIGECIGASCFAGGDDLHFTGNLDGNSRIISNLYINRPTEFGVGIFELIDNSSIYDLVLDNFDVTALGFGGSLVGVKIRSNLSDITVMNSNIYTTNYSGGVVGYDYLNGYSKDIIVNNVNVSGIFRVGGFSGMTFYTDIENPYISNVNVYGNNTVGGVSGSIQHGDINKGYIQANIEATGGSNNGGVVGFGVETEITNLNVITNINSAYYLGGIVGELISNSLINNSNVTSTITSLYDNLGGVVGYIGSASTIENVRAITNITGTDNLGGIVGQIVSSGSLIKKSVATVNLDGDDYIGGIVANVAAGNNILNSESSGKINGDTYLGGLSGFIQINSIINNSNSNVDVNGTQYIGGFIGLNFGEIYNGSSNSEVNGTYYVGGFAGRNEYNGAIYDSSSISNISGINYVGGFVGRNWGQSGSYHSTINNSWAESKIIATDTVGGFVGRNDDYSTINNSHTVDSIITANRYVGGFVGYYYNDVNSLISRSYSKNNILNVVRDTGGFVGMNYKGHIYESFSENNTINVSSYNSGGFVGYNWGGSSGTFALIDNSYSLNNVIGDGNLALGGFVGVNQQNAFINNSYSANIFNGPSGVSGGFVGDFVNGRIDNSFDTSEAIAPFTNEDGFAGRVYAAANYNNLYWNDMATNPSVSGLSVNITTISDNISYFYNESNEPLASWDFINLWESDGISLPILRNIN